MKKLLTAVFSLLAVCASAQSISSETIEFEVLKLPEVATDMSFRTYNVIVASPYNLTKEDVIRQSKMDYEDALANYDETVLQSEQQYQQKLEDYDKEVEKAKEKYEFEQKEFNKLSLIERMALIDQGRNPRLINPSKPVYYKPQVPQYKEPNLSDYIIVDNSVLASQIEVAGFRRADNPYLDIYIDIQATNFQDNAGQTYANQPTQLLVKLDGREDVNASFFQDYEFISSYPTNNINKVKEEKYNLERTVKFLNQYLNDRYGYQLEKEKVEILTVKNKKHTYDDLERANIYVTTNLKKLRASSDPKANEVAFANMQKGIDIWNETLSKIDYQDNKSDFNSNIAKFIYFNLIRLNLALDNKEKAEEYLNQMQENLVYIKLSSSETSSLKKLENRIYTR